MAITTAQYVERVWYDLSKGNPEIQAGVYRSAIESALPQALNDLAELIAKSDPPTRALLQSDFSFTLSSGEAVLSGNPTLIPRYIAQSGYVTLSGLTEPLCWVPHRADLTASRLPSSQTDYNFYTVADGKIIVRTNTGAIPSATALTVMGSYVPTISQVPDGQLVDELVGIGVAIAREGQNKVEEAEKA